MKEVMPMTEAQSRPKIFRDFLTSLTFEEREGEAAWLGGIRRRAYEKFHEVGIPSRKLEGWKFTNLEALLKASFFPPSNDGLKVTRPQDFQRDFFGQEEENRLVFLNGAYSEEFSALKNLPAGVFAGKIAAATRHEPDRVKKYLARGLENESGAFALLNTLYFQDGAFVGIPRDRATGRPIHLLFLDAADGREPVHFHPRILIALEDGAKADLVIQILGHPGRTYFMNTVLEIYLGKNAWAECVLIERESEEHFQFLSTRAKLSEGSRLGMVTFSHGGRILRNETAVELEGQNSTCELRGLSMLHGISQVSHVVSMNHRAERGTSRQIYKNILSEKARTEFNSLVHVWPGAQKADSFQLNRNLLMSDEARAYSRPQLLIYADDVKAVHGSATGRLEGDELFYLRSRGLSEKEARFVLTYGFAEEVIRSVHPISLRGQLEAFVKQELGRMFGS